MPIETLLTLPYTLTHTRVPLPEDEDFDPDEHGNSQPVTTVSTGLCHVEHVLGAGADEARLGEIATSDWRAFLPSGESVARADAITVEQFGDFEVFGEPAPMWDPSLRRFSHIEARLRRNT